MLPRDKCQKCGILVSVPGLNLCNWCQIEMINEKKNKEKTFNTLQMLNEAYSNPDIIYEGWGSEPYSDEQIHYSSSLNKFYSPSRASISLNDIITFQRSNMVWRKTRTPRKIFPNTPIKIAFSKTGPASLVGDYPTITEEDTEIKQWVLKYDYAKGIYLEEVLDDDTRSV